MSSRKRARDLTRWEEQARQWATTAGRTLALDLYRNDDPAIHPYGLGLVLWDGEKVWARLPARCSADTPLAVRAGRPRRGDPPPEPRIGDWLVTSHRVAGRLWPDSLSWWEWASVVGVRVDLSPGRELVQLDVQEDADPVSWTGPGVAPLAVAAVFHLYGARAMIDHPGLELLRSTGHPTSAPAPE
ncbi:MAG: hypothetical protein J2P57_23225 [Acidimicrobiaceae bacterium]|nr:hypothetical protein [Acidimicrobiaceae bacterium]